MRWHLPRVLIAVAVVAIVIVLGRGNSTPLATTAAHTSVAEKSTEVSAPTVALTDAVVAVETPEEVPSSATLSVWFQELPRASQLPEDVHFAPPGVARAGERFGAMYDAAKKTPAFRDTAAQFFSTCAEDTTVLDGIRALCLHNWREFRPPSAVRIPVTDDRIQRIADFLPKNPRS